jgi:hypothetical protein
VDNIATGSDYMAFNQYLGIPSAEIRYVASKASMKDAASHKCVGQSNCREETI